MEMDVPFAAGSLALTAPALTPRRECKMVAYQPRIEAFARGLTGSEHELRARTDAGEFSADGITGIDPAYAPLLHTFARARAALHAVNVHDPAVDAQRKPLLIGKTMRDLGEQLVELRRAGDGGRQFLETLDTFAARAQDAAVNAPHDEREIKSALYREVRNSLGAFRTQRGSVHEAHARAFIVVLAAVAKSCAHFIHLERVRQAELLEGRLRMRQDAAEKLLARQNARCTAMERRMNDLHDLVNTAGREAERLNQALDNITGRIENLEREQGVAADEVLSRQARLEATIRNGCAPRDVAVAALAKKMLRLEQAFTAAQGEQRKARDTIAKLATIEVRAFETQARRNSAAFHEQHDMTQKLQDLCARVGRLEIKSPADGPTA